MASIELVVPQTAAQVGDLALVSRAGSPAMIDLKETVLDVIDEAGAYGLAPFETRALAELAAIPDYVDTIQVYHPAATSASSVLLSYKRDVSGTALTTTGGITWSPVGDVYPQHFGAVANATTDDSAAINAALAYSSVVYGKGAYGVGATITGVNKAFLGQHSIGPNRSRLIGLSATLPITSPVVEFGGASKFDGWSIEYDTLTGTETRGQRIGLSTGYAGNILQRGSTLDNLRFDNVGTALTDKGVGGFSITFGTISVARFSHAAADFYSVGATGNEWGNFYCGAVSSTFTPAYGINIEGTASGGSFGQINIEHTLFSGAALRVAKAKNISVNLLHMEGVGTSAAGLSYVDLSEASLEIANMEVLHTRADYDNIALFDLKAATFNTGTSYAGTSAKNQLTIGTMQLRGLAAPDLATYPSYPAGRRGLANVVGWKFFRRDGAYANTNYKVRVGTFTWAAYPSQTSDPAIFEAASSTYSDRSRIDFVSFGDLGVETAKPFSRSAFNSDAEFTTAATALGYDFPTPYLTKWDLPKQSIDLMHIGVKPSNLLADAADNVVAIQTVIDWLSSKTNGGTIRGGSFHPSHNNPIIALRKAVGQQYALLLKPKVSLEFGPGVRFRAAEAMETMVETAADLVGGSFTGRLKNISIRGGFWDAGRLADHCFRVRDFEDIHFGHNGMILQSALRSCLRLGDPLRPVNSYGFYADSFKVANANSAYGGAAVAAIESVHGFSDSHFNHLLLEGYPMGITGDIYISRMMDCHAWSFPDTQGPLMRGFNCSGGQNVYWGMQVDNPYEAAFYVDSGDNYRFIGCTSTMDLSAIVDPGKPASGTIPVFRVNPAAAAGTTLHVIGCFGNDRAATTFSRMAAYPVGADVTVRDSFLRYGSVEQEVIRSFPTTSARITTIAGSNPTVNTSQNIASVTRTADADYTFTMTNGQPTLDYQISISCLPTSYPQTLIPIIRDKQLSSFRIQFVDSAGAFIRPATVTVSTKRM